MITQTIEIQGLERTLAALLKVEDDITHLRPLFERFGTEVYSDEVKLFAAQPWAPLSPKTIAQKQRQGQNKGILRAEDTFYRSLTQQGAPGNIHRVSDLDAEFGTSDFKGILHKLGTRKMPARDPMAELDVDKYANLAERYLADVVRNAGFN